MAIETWRGSWEFEGNERVGQRLEKEPFRAGDLTTRVGKVQAQTAFPGSGVGEPNGDGKVRSDPVLTL